MSERWQQVREILQSALQHSPNEREQFLEEVCGSDQSLRREVKNLLLASENVGSFMEQAAICEVAETFVSTENGLQTGAPFNQYKILSPIGAGGMGEVYLAHDTKLNRRVALKLLPQSLTTDENANRRLLREARAAALDHLHICQIYEIGESAGRSFIVMQFYEGETLAEKLSLENLSLSETLDFAVQIADALANAHSRNIVHCDIKPANIIVNKQRQAKILDFGLAKNFGENANAESEVETAQLKSQANTIVGTPPYMSPEQACGERLDARTDIFSFGALLYEMLSGNQLFKRESYAETASAVLNYEPQLAQTIPDAPLELQRILRKCLAKDKEKRYQTAKDLMIDLQNVQHDLGLRERSGHAAELQSETKTQILDVAGTTNKSPVRTNTMAGESENRRLGFIVGSIILLFAVAGLGYWFFVSRSAKAIESIAVLPFVNESDNLDAEYLSDGMTETLIGSLSQIPKLNVKARSSVFRYKGKDADAQTVGKELNVQAVFTGRVVQRGHELTLFLSLVDAANGNNLWSKPYNRKLTNLVALQNEIARDVSDNLKTKLSGAEEQKLTKNYTANAEAYRLYLQGRYFWNKRTEKDIRKSIEYYNQALELDPNYALAYAGIADAYTNLSAGGYSPLHPAQGFPKAKEAALKALEIDNTLAEAHVPLGFVKDRYEWDFAAAENEYERAIELKPEYAPAHQRYGVFLGQMGRFDESIAALERTRELAPLSLIIATDLGLPYFWSRRYEKAVEILQKALEIDPNFAWAHLHLSNNYREMGRYEEAFAESQKYFMLSGGLYREDGRKRINFTLATAYAAAGRKGEARKILDEMDESVKRGEYNTPLPRAIIYCALGDKEQAFAWLEKAYADRVPGMVELNVNPWWDIVRDDPRFEDLVKRVGLQQ
jgi:serine/threonine-protein kinase